MCSRAAVRRKRDRSSRSLRASDAPRRRTCRHPAAWTVGVPVTGGDTAPLSITRSVPPFTVRSVTSSRPSGRKARPHGVLRPLAITSSLTVAFSVFNTTPEGSATNAGRVFSTPLCRRSTAPAARPGHRSASPRTRAFRYSGLRADGVRQPRIRHRGEPLFAEQRWGTATAEVSAVATGAVIHVECGCRVCTAAAAARGRPGLASTCRSSRRLCATLGARLRDRQSQHDSENDRGTVTVTRRLRMLTVYRQSDPLRSVRFAPEVCWSRTPGSGRGSVTAVVMTSHSVFPVPEAIKCSTTVA